MRNFAEYLDEFKKTQGLKTDSALGVALGVSKQYVWKARNYGIFSDEQCLQIARAIGVPEYEVIISRNLLKETGPMHEVWAKAAKRLGGTLAIGGALIGMSYMTADNMLFTDSLAMLPIFITGNIGTSK